MLWYLSGLTCTHANVMEKGEYRAACAKHAIILIAPDTSPRGEDVPDAEGYDFGKGAGFYVDATEEPWAAHYRMRSYVEEELPALVAEHFPVDMERQSIFGHSMGGHGALTIALRNPGRFRSISAFAPIVTPSQVPWGEKAFGGYLGDDRAAWRGYDAVGLIENGARVDELFIDQGHRRRVPRRAFAHSPARSSVRRRGHPRHDQDAGRLRPFLLLHLHFHARPRRLARRAAEALRGVYARRPLMDEFAALIERLVLYAQPQWQAGIDRGIPQRRARIPIAAGRWRD